MWSLDWGGRWLRGAPSPRAPDIPAGCDRPDCPYQLAPGHGHALALRDRRVSRAAAAGHYRQLMRAPCACDRPHTNLVL